jgi:excisionase family DNA binding protein
MPLLLAEEVARHIKVPRPEVYKLVERGDLPAIRIGRRLRFDPIAVLEFVDSHRSER